MDEKLKEKLDSYLKNQRDQEKKLQESTQERRNFAQDLIQREKNFETEKLKKKIEEEMKLKEHFRNIELQKQEKDKEQQLYKEQKLREDSQKSEFWQQINSIKIKWGKKNKVAYNVPLLTAIFNIYGGIKHIEIFAAKRTAIIEFLTLKAAEEAVKDNTYQGDSDDEETFKDQLRVKFLLKQKKREELVQQLMKPKQNLQQDNFELNTSTIERLGNMINRSSKFQNLNLQDTIKRKMERQNLLEKIINSEI